MEYADGTCVGEVNIERLPSFEIPSLAGALIVKLALGRELGMSTIGQPVSVVFNTCSGSSIGSAVGKL
jgi:alginate biosynthesis protein Alg44